MRGPPRRKPGRTWAGRTGRGTHGGGRPRRSWTPGSRPRPRPARCGPPHPPPTGTRRCWRTSACWPSAPGSRSGPRPPSRRRRRRRHVPHTGLPAVSWPCCGCWPPGAPTPRSAPSCTSAPRPRACTSAASCASSASPAGCRPPPWPNAPASCSLSKPEHHPRKLNTARANLNTRAPQSWAFARFAPPGLTRILGIAHRRTRAATARRPPGVPGSSTPGGPVTSLNDRAGTLASRLTPAPGPPGTLSCIPLLTPVGAAVTAAGLARRAADARELAESLLAREVHAVAVTIVDNAGLARAKTAPVTGLEQATRWGLGLSPVFAVAAVDDSFTTSTAAGGPAGDLRLMPDPSALRVAAAQPGWAWAPADQYTQDGQVFGCCQRSFTRRMADLAGLQGLEVKVGTEIEWFLGRDEGGALVPAHDGPGYGLAALDGPGKLADYGRGLLAALGESGIRVGQFHPEYAPRATGDLLAGRRPGRGRRPERVRPAHHPRPLDPAGLAGVLRARRRARPDRQRRAPAPEHLARRPQPARRRERPARHDARRRGVHGRHRGRASGPDRGRRAQRRQLPAAAALPLGRCLRLLGTRKPGSRAAVHHRHDRRPGSGRQRRDQMLRPGRQPLPGHRITHRRGPGGTRQAAPAAARDRHRPRLLRACQARARPPAAARNARSGANGPAALPRDPRGHGSRPLRRVHRRARRRSRSISRPRRRGHRHRPPVAVLTARTSRPGRTLSAVTRANPV